MLKKILLQIVFITLLSVFTTSSLFAGNARTTAMGMTNETLWMIQTDEGYIDMNPAYLSKYNQEIFYNTVKKYGGIIINPFNPLNIFVSTGSPLPSLVTDMGFPAGWGAFSPAVTAITQEQMNVTGSYVLGGMAFALKLAYTSVHDKNYTTATTDTKHSLIRSKIGAFIDLGSGMDIDASLGVDKWSITNGATDYESAPFDFRLLTRFNMALSEEHKLHVLLDMNMIDRTSKTAGVEAADEYKVLNFGVSDEINIKKTSLVYAGVNFIYGTREYSPAAGTTERGFRSLKFSAGMETAVTETIIIRTGFYKYWYYFESQKLPSGVDGDKETEKPTTAANFHIGMGYKLGNVDFAWEIAQALIQNGPYIISGGTAATSANFEVTYHFDSTASSRETVTPPKSSKRR